MKLLIAEDEYTTRLTVQVVLEQWGYNVDSVEDGTSAWKILQKAALAAGLLSARFDGRAVALEVL